MSKRFNSIATPIVYRHFAVSNELVASRPDLVVARIASHVQAYTRKVDIRSGTGMNWYRIVRFLSGC